MTITTPGHPSIQGVGVHHEDRDTRPPGHPFIQAVPGIVANQAGLFGFQCPPPTVNPIPFIAWPPTDGLRCHEYGFIVRTPQGIQRQDVAGVAETEETAETETKETETEETGL